MRQSTLEVVHRRLTLLSKTLTPSDKLAVAGYFANLMVCTPAWRRIGVTIYNDNARSFLISAKNMVQKHGGDHDVPVDEIEMLERGEITIEHDPNYIKATVTQDLMKYAWSTYHQDWTIIQNATGHPFITSDNPVAIQTSTNAVGPMTRYLPITPSLCLSVRYGPSKLPPINPTMPPRGAVKWETISEQGAKLINKLVAQCAEDLVFSSAASTGIEALIKKCATFRVEAEFFQLPANEPDAGYQISIIRVRDTRKAVQAKSSVP